MPKCPLMWHLNGRNFCWKTPVLVSAGCLMTARMLKPSLRPCLMKRQPIYGSTQSSWMIVGYCVTVWLAVGLNVTRPACHLGVSDWQNVPAPTNYRNGKKASSIFRMKDRRLPLCYVMHARGCRWPMSVLVRGANLWSWLRACRIKGVFWLLIIVPSGWSAVANVCAVQASIMSNAKSLMTNGARENGAPNLTVW